MMGSLLQLESFDDAADFETIGTEAPATPPGYEVGFAEGLAAAEATFADEQIALKASLVEAVQVAALDHQAAQETVLKAMLPLLDAMVETLLPALLAPALYAQLTDLVTSAARADAAAPINLAVAPHQVASVEDALEGLALQGVSVVADPALTDHAAWVSAPSGETALNLDAALTEIQAHLSNLKILTTDNGATRHG